MNHADAPTHAATDSCQAEADLEAVFSRYQAQLLGTLYHLVGNEDDARDALQEAFVKCWRHREKVPEVANLKAWVFRIALNTGRDLRQTAWRRKKHPLPASEAMVQTSGTTPTQIAEQNEQLLLLRQAITQLREEEQEVFLLRQNGDMTYEEIATSIGIPTGTVKTRMRLALQKLRKVMSSV
jgi:RNA polymerase sigma factor (sigma-70 family)